MDVIRPARHRSRRAAGPSQGPGFALFHDFNDPRNSMEEVADYGVYQGVMDGLRTDRWEFWGIYGCTGLFRRIGPC